MAKKRNWKGFGDRKMFVLTLKVGNHYLHVLLGLDVVVISILVGKGLLARPAGNLTLGTVCCLGV